MDGSLVSVIVTTYNRESLISQTIDSILNQTYRNVELIIVDDGSTDKTKEVIMSYNDNRIRYFKTDNWGGPARPRNIGIEESKGDLIAFCDDDDIWIENKLHIQVSKIEESNCDFVYSNMYHFKTNIHHIFGVSRNRKIININDLLRKNQINTSTVLVKKNPHLKFSEKKEYTVGEDYDLWLRLYQNGLKFEFIEDPLIYYRLWGNNISKKNWASNHLVIILVKINFLLKHQRFSILSTVFFNVLFNFLKYFLKLIYCKIKKFNNN